MASFSMEDFIGNGVLKSLLPKLLDEGWDDVPTLKLHDRALMQYADKLEVTGKSLTELLNFRSAELSTMFAMKRGHFARFTNMTTPCGSSPLPASYSISARRQGMKSSRTSSTSRSELSSTYSRSSSITMSELSSNDFRSSLRIPKPLGRNLTLEQSLSDLKIKDGYVFKGKVACTQAESRACGFGQAPPLVDELAPYCAIENISVQRLTSEYKVGAEHLVKTKTASMKALEIWREKPAVLVCIRRPGYTSILHLLQDAHH